MKKQVFNPYLPSYEYIPDAEPHVFGDRVYIYGSHDYFNGHVFCLGDYVCYSAPINDLSDWRFEGTIYKKSDDPLNRDEKMCLYAPDCVQGKDGRFYLYYVLDKISVVSVAVCDTPCGVFKFYGYVHYKDGTKLGEKQGDEPQFDPAVILENDKIYLYTGFCPRGDKSRHGAMCTVLDLDGLTVLEEPKIIVPGCEYSEKSTFVNHEFFEASSIRKVGDFFVFVYSSILMHELCYAYSKKPDCDFVYGGVIVSNCDLGIDSYKPKEKPTAFGANNHGGIEKIGDDYYIFYHRHTNGIWYSRQTCAEKIQVLQQAEKLEIPQVEITSCGLNEKFLKDSGFYAGYIACNLFNDKCQCYVSEMQPKITQDGRDGDKNDGYVSNITNNTTIGFKYFEIQNLKEIKIETRGYINGFFEIRTKIDGTVYAKINVISSNVWESNSAKVDIPCGKKALYFTFVGEGTGHLKGITLI